MRSDIQGSRFVTHMKIMSQKDIARMKRGEKMYKRYQTCNIIFDHLVKLSYFPDSTIDVSYLRKNLMCEANFSSMMHA